MQYALHGWTDINYSVTTPAHREIFTSVGNLVTADGAPHTHPNKLGLAAAEASNWWRNYYNGGISRGSYRVHVYTWRTMSACNSACSAYTHILYTYKLNRPYPSKKPTTTSSGIHKYYFYRYYYPYYYCYYHRAVPTSFVKDSTWTTQKTKIY